VKRTQPVPAVIGTGPAPTTTSANDYLDRWDEYWQAFALTAARKSKDPRCRVGAVIVCDDLILSTGFNGFARQLFDDPKLLADAEEKLRLICHAEQNAIHNAARLGVSLAGATIYVTKFPCLACCNAIIQAGIVRIHTHDTKYWNDDPADQGHTRKKSALRQAKIEVDAPFHPDYAPRAVEARQATAVTGARSDQSAGPIALAAVPPPRRRRAKAGAKPTEKSAEPPGENMNLFPARRAIRGGKSDS